ncbi:lyase family protein [Microbacterium lacticum]|uniref:lyase family protein n=1 Tax=Microbacterium lacticum TaxID=33885 RepID=UPI001F57956C|nr:lyase family protein [Microbacterium lacticum]
MTARTVASLFTPRAKRQRWLEVEAALAQAEAEAGIIPAEAAAKITAHADISQIDEIALAANELATGHVMVPLVSALADLTGPEHGGWVHWGATTQNIQQSGDTVGVRDAHRILTGRIERILTVLADMSETHAETAMAGRTHGQHAVPITFGYKVAVWADIFSRHLHRMRQVEPRLFVSMTGGAAGTFATFGELGPQIQQGVAERIGLSPMAVPSRAIADHFAEWVNLLALIAAAAQSIAEEVVRLMSAEFCELEEALPDTDVGSSTMPQKRNAKMSMAIITAAAQARALAPLATEATIHAHEVDGARSAVMDRALEQSASLLDEILERLETLLTGLRIHPERMRDNLHLTRGLITAEAVMMRLAARIGRQEAHTLVHHAAVRAATTGERFADVLAAEEGIASRLSDDDIHDLLDPEHHLGLSARLAKETAMRVRDQLAADSRIDCARAKRT